MIRHLLIADDHPICCAALTAAAQQIDSAICVDTASSLVKVQELLAARRYVALLLDLNLEDVAGLDGLAAVRAAHPDLPVAVVSSSSSPALINGARALGARGFISKAALVDEMRDAIAAILEGRTCFPADVGAGDSNPYRNLTAAQLRVLRELRAGHANKEIAFRLDLAEQTVKSHVSAILRVLGVSNRSQALLALREMEL